MDKKCVMIINEYLSKGIAANIAAIMGMSLGKKIPHIIGQDIVDQDGNQHLGIIEIPVPILKDNNDHMKKIYQKLSSYEDNDITIIDFSTLAQRCRTYKEYIHEMNCTQEAELEYIGIALYGNKKVINKLTGNLSLLK